MQKPHVYSWDEEPIDERPSEFSGSTGYASLSGFHATGQAHRHPQRRSRFGFKSMLGFSVVLLAVGAWVLYKVTRMSHG